MIPHSFTQTGISVFVNGKPFMIPTDHINYDNIIEALKNKEWDNILDLVDVKKFIEKVSFGDVVITEDDEVYYKNKKVNEYLANHIISLTQNNLPIDSIINFTEKLMENPDISVRNDLYKWLENGNTPIYDDGDFVAYKVVLDDFKSCHDNNFDNTPGKIVKMNREDCDNNRNNTCSSGLHFCSYDYLSGFGAGHIGRSVVLLKINPKNVVAIPNDYNMTKGRACEYFVSQEIEYEKIKEEIEGELVQETETSDVLENYEFIFTASNGDKYTRDQLNRALRENAGNITQTGKKLGVPRTTLSGWLRKLRAN